MKRLRRGPLDGMLNRATAQVLHGGSSIFWSSPEISPKNQTDLNAQRQQRQERSHEVSRSKTARRSSCRAAG